jgi:hypothetical protein
MAQAFRVAKVGVDVGRHLVTVELTDRPWLRPAWSFAGDSSKTNGREIECAEMDTKSPIRALTQRERGPRNAR